MTFDSYDWLVSLVVMPAGYAVAGTLWGAAVLVSVPCVLVALLPGIRAIRRDEDGRIVGPPPRTARSAGIATHLPEA